ncbi:hypothetical protein [Labrys sp. WJW]|uniref:hypothetical protein n=1 Tax=Labrys sp. WJW TaxID=1737983 RepID=UPI0012E9F529|nr:hypothetical protein [Labrys sp. WJW]
MGLRICYLASPIPAGEFAQRIGLSLGPNVSQAPDRGWWIAELKNHGWSILWAENEDFGRAIEQTLMTLSKTGADVILCEVNETVMWSSAECWSGGKSVWRITHAGDGENRYDLTVEGTPPNGFSTIRELHFDAQRYDDDCVDHIFDIPLNVAAEQHGFRHDVNLDADEVGGFWIVTPQRKGGLLSRLLGR